jgi:hypothetical protein
LANGRLLAYDAVVPSLPGGFASRFASLDSTVKSPSWEPLVGARFVDDRTVLLFRGDVLFRQAVDLATGPVGDPIIVQRGISATRGRALLSATSQLLVVRLQESLEDRRFAWFDRQGVEIGTVTAPPGARNPVLSLDGRVLAFEVFQGESALRDVHVIDVQDGRTTRVATDASDDADAFLSSDGTRILFGKNGFLGKRDFVLKTIEDGDQVVIEALIGTSQSWPQSWSADGAYVLYNDNATGCAAVAAKAGKQAPVAKYESAGDCRFSPNGRFVAFLDNSANSNVFVEPFPPTGARWQVSKEGGTEPMWHPGGRELYYLALDRTLMAADVTLSPDFKLGAPHPLFRARIPSPARTGTQHNYAVAPDGRFLISTVKPGTEPPSLLAIVSWQSPADVSSASR